MESRGQMDNVKEGRDGQCKRGEGRIYRERAGEGGHSTMCLSPSQACLLMMPGLAMFISLVLAILCKKVKN